MARIETDPNYLNPTFSRATAPEDLFKKEDVQNVAAALSTHDHSDGKGLAIAAAGLADGSITSDKLADGTIQGTDLTLPFDLPGVFRSTGVTGGLPAAGTGVEIYWNPTPGISAGAINAYDRSAAAFKDLAISAQVLTLTSQTQLVLFAAGQAIHYDGTAFSLSHPAGVLAAANMIATASMRTRGNLLVGPEAASIGLSAPAINQLLIQGRLGVGINPQADYGLSLQNTPSLQGGMAIATRWDVYSSERFKAAIQPIANALEVVRDDRVHGVRFEPVEGGDRTVGFIAEQWVTVEPSLVSVDDQGEPVAMSYANVGAITFEALKQLTATVDDLTARVATLEAA